jgi:hypothetical protein
MVITICLANVILIGKVQKDFSVEDIDFEQDVAKIIINDLNADGLKEIIALTYNKINNIRYTINIIWQTSGGV